MALVLKTSKSEKISKVRILYLPLEKEKIMCDIQNKEH